jgi:hypothetical protein
VQQLTVTHVILANISQERLVNPVIALVHHNAWLVQQPIVTHVMQINISQELFVLPVTALV